MQAPRNVVAGDCFARPEVPGAATATATKDSSAAPTPGDRSATLGIARPAPEQSHGCIGVGQRGLGRVAGLCAVGSAFDSVSWGRGLTRRQGGEARRDDPPRIPARIRDHRRCWPARSSVSRLRQLWPSSIAAAQPCQVPSRLPLTVRMGGESNAAAVAGQGPTNWRLLSTKRAGAEGSFRAVSLVMAGGYQAVSVGAR
jgi:hypothetical protein